MRKNRKNAKLEFAELVNSEGPILVAYKKEGRFIIVDEDRENIEVLSEESMFDWVEGKLSIKDSRERVWTYPSISEGMKIEKAELIDFIGSKYEIARPKLREKFLEWMEENGKFAWEDAVDQFCDLLEENPHLIKRKS
jgi:hypothetical protein